MLPEDVVHEIDVLVRTRAFDRARLVDIFCEEMYEPGELDRFEVEAQVDAATASLSDEVRSWPQVTDFDRLEAAFSNLNLRGVISLFDAGNTQSEGYEDFQSALANHVQPSIVKGYCFYHSQDAERAIDGGGLFLAFGPTNPDDEESGGAAIGAIVREELERAGLRVEWSGSFSQRIHLPDFRWQRR